MIDFSDLSGRRAAPGRLWVSFAIAFAFLTPLLSCSETKPNPLGHETAAPIRLIRIATSGDYAPFSLWAPDAGAPPAGFSVELARAFAESEQSEIEWVRFRWPSLLGDLEAGRFDLALSGITVRPERSVAGRFSLPVTRSGLVVLVAEGDPARHPEDLDRPGIRLAVNAGGHLERAARALLPRATILAIDHNQEVPEQGKRGEVDGVVTDSIEAPHWLPRWPGARAIGPFTRDRKAALLPAAREDLARRLDDWLLEAEARGELARLRAVHGLPAQRTATPQAALLASLDERLALMEGVARAKSILGLAVEDRAREIRVLEAAWRSVEEAAREAGHAPPPRSAVRALFEAQIEAAKWIQHEVIAEARDPGGSDGEATESDATRREAARRELDQALRPALIRIGDRIARLVARSAPAGFADAPSRADVARALADHGLPPAHLHAIQEALTELSRPAERGA